MMMMPMYFWKGEKLTWLFYLLESNTSTEYFVGLISVFLVAVGLQMIEYLRNFVYIKAQMRAI